MPSDSGAGRLRVIAGCSCFPSRVRQAAGRIKSGCRRPA